MKSIGAIPYYRSNCESGQRRVVKKMGGGQDGIGAIKRQDERGK